MAIVPEVHQDAVGKVLFDAEENGELRGGEVSSSSSTRIRGKRVAAVHFVERGGVSGAKVGSVAVDVDKDKAASRQVRT